MRYLSLILLFIASCQSEHLNVELEPKVYLGKVKYGEPVDFRVKCKNNGEKDVILDEVNVSCSCIRIREKNPSKIQAHDSCTFYFQLLPEGIGYIERSLELHFKEFTESHRVLVSAHVEN